MAVSLRAAFSIQRCLPWLLALLSMSASSSADTSVNDLSFLWVATSGNDISACGTTSDDPCQTIAYGLGRFPQASEMASNATLRVAAGTYSVPVEGINFEGRPVLIVGEEGTVVDCNGSPKGFVATSSEPSTAVSPLHRALATADQPTSSALLTCCCTRRSRPAHSVCAPTLCAVTLLLSYARKLSDLVHSPDRSAFNLSFLFAQTHSWSLQPS